MKQSLVSLIQKAKEITASGLPLMEGKTKTDFSDGEVFTVKEYGYLEGENGDFVVVADEKTFTYGGSVVTEAFKGLDEKLTGDEIEELLQEGIPMKISKKKSKNGRKYTTCEFFPQ
jgi:hypothetical protein